MVDESTDIACQSTMCVVVRFYDHESKIVISRFWELLQVFDIKNLDTVDKGATAENLFNICIESFKKYNLNLDNLVGFGSDDEKIDDQWRNLPLYKLSENIINEKEPDRFRTCIKDLECEQFKDLAVFSISVLCLPHSNASCERIFSKINSVKTKSRNKLITSTVSSTVISSESIKEDNGNCISFKPIKDMLARMTSSNLYPIAADMTQSTSCQDFVIED